MPSTTHMLLSMPGTGPDGDEAGMPSSPSDSDNDPWVASRQPSEANSQGLLGGIEEGEEDADADERRASSWPVLCRTSSLGSGSDTAVVELLLLLLLAVMLLRPTLPVWLLAA